MAGKPSGPNEVEAELATPTLPSPCTPAAPNHPDPASPSSVQKESKFKCSGLLGCLTNPAEGGVSKPKSKCNHVPSTLAGGLEVQVHSSLPLPLEAEAEVEIRTTPPQKADGVDRSRSPSGSAATLHLVGSLVVAPPARAHTVFCRLSPCSRHDSPCSGVTSIGSPEQNLGNSPDPCRAPAAHPPRELY